MGDQLDRDRARQAWFAYFRFYGPTEGYFNRTYALPNFEEVTN